MLSTVVCDDDDVLRGVVRELAEGHGLQVIAETDHGLDVVELVRRFGIELVILDLVLPDVSGESVLRLLREQDLHPRVVVFTAYEPDRATLRDLGVQWVVHKPDLDKLGAALDEAAGAPVPEAPSGADAGAAAPAEERRRPRREVRLEPPVWRSPSGVEPRSTLDHHLRTCLPGDSLVAVAPDGLPSLEHRFGTLLAHDCLLTIARTFRSTLRTQDSVLDEPDCEGLLLVLRGGDDRAATAAWARARDVLDRAPGDVTVRGTWTVVSGSAAEARARVVGAALGAPPATFSPA